MSIKFCFKQGKNVTGTFNMLNVAFEEQTVEEQKFLGDFSNLKSAVKTSEDVKCSGTSITKQRT
jgi:hypothetical protein